MAKLCFASVLLILPVVGILEAHSPLQNKPPKRFDDQSYAADGNMMERFKRDDHMTPTLKPKYGGNGQRDVNGGQGAQMNRRQVEAERLRADMRRLVQNYIATHPEVTYQQAVDEVEQNNPDLLMRIRENNAQGY